MTTTYTTRPELTITSMAVIYSWLWDDAEVWEDNNSWLDAWWATEWTSYTVRTPI